MANRARPILWLALGCAAGVLIVGLGAGTLLYAWVAASAVREVRAADAPRPVRLDPASFSAFAEREVRADQVDFPWPLTVERGILRLYLPERAVVFVHQGAGYAVNGTASRMARERGWREIDALRPAPDAAGGRPSIAPLTRLGLDLAEESGPRSF